MLIIIFWKINNFNINIYLNMFDWLEIDITGNSVRIINLRVPIRANNVQIQIQLLAMAFYSEDS